MKVFRSPQDIRRGRGGRRLKRGQALTEYVVIISLAVVGSLITVTLFGSMVAGTVSRLGKTFDNEAIPDDTAVGDILDDLDHEDNIERDMRDFDQPEAIGARGVPTMPESPPVATDPLAYSARHHLGDNWSQGAMGADGNLINEGLSYTVDFFLTQEMIDYANYASDGTLFLTFNAGNREFYGGNFIDNENVDTVLINGQSVGNARNGRNVMTFNVGDLSPGALSVTFTSGPLSTERDDYDFWNLMIGYSAPAP